MYHGKNVSHRAILHNYLNYDSTAPFLCSQSCSQLDERLKTTKCRTRRSLSTGSNVPTMPTRVMQQRQEPKKKEDMGMVLKDESWLHENEPAEALYLKALRSREGKCSIRQKVARLDKATRSRFMTMRKFVSDHQRALLKKYNSVHSRTMDLGLIYAEQFLIENLDPKVSDRSSAAFCTGALPGGGFSAAARLDDRHPNLVIDKTLRKELSLLANVALWIACKFEEVQPPLVDVFLKSNYDEFYLFEMTLCQVMDWKFNHVTSSDYISFFMASEGVKGGSLSTERIISNWVQESCLWFQHGLLELTVASIVLGCSYVGDERLMISANVLSVSGVEKEALIAAMDDLHDFLYDLASKDSSKMETSRFPSLGTRITHWKPAKHAAESAVSDRFEVWRKRSRAIASAFPEF